MAESPGFTGLGALSLPGFPVLPLPRSVRHLATMVAGAYQPHRPPNPWLPGVPAQPGLCYWLVPSGSPLGWREGCLAVKLVRGTVCHYCLGGCSALVLCARRSRRVRGAGAGAGSPVPPAPPLLPPRAPRCVCRVVRSRYPFSSPAVTPFHSVCAFRGLGLVAPQVRPACHLRVCALALPRRPRPSRLPGLVWRAHHAWFRGRAPVGPFNAIHVPPCFLPLSGAPSSQLRRGSAGSLPPCTWLRVLRPLVGSPVRPRWSSTGGGGPCAAPSQGHGWRARGGGGRVVTLPWSVPLPPLSGHQSGLHWRCSVHGGCGLHTAPACVTCASVLARSAGFPFACRRAACGQVGRPAGAAARRGHCGSGRVMVWLRRLKLHGQKRKKR